MLDTWRFCSVLWCGLIFLPNSLGVFLADAIWPSTVLFLRRCLLNLPAWYEYQDSYYRRVSR